MSSLSPDQQWQLYKDSGGLLPHERTSPETRDAIREVKLEFEKRIGELKDDHISPLETNIEKIAADVKNKVSFKIFTWVLSILMAIVIGWMGIIWVTLQQLGEKTNTVNYNVGLIQWRLDNFEVTK